MNEDWANQKDLPPFNPVEDYESVSQNEDQKSDHYQEKSFKFE